MQLESPERIPSRVVSDDQDRDWDEEKEDDCSDDTVNGYEGMVLGHIFESVSHS